MQILHLWAALRNPKTPAGAIWLRHCLATVAICLALVATPAFAQRNSGPALLYAIEESIVKAVEKAEPGVVSIARAKKRPDDEAARARLNRFGVPLGLPEDDIRHPNYIPNDFGSGVVLGEIVVENGRRVTAILTNYHVVKGADTHLDGRADGSAPRRRAQLRLSVRYRGERSGKDAKIWSADPRSDLAIITIDAVGLRPIKMAVAHKFKKGQFVLALGNTYALAHNGGSPSVSWGIISNIGRRASDNIANPDGTVPDSTGAGNERLYHLGRLLQVDTNLNLGMSGGALINFDGELIGLTTSLAALAGYEKSAGYAIPVDDTTRRVIHTLLKGYEVEYGFLGVSFGDAQALHLRGDERGAEIDQVLQNLPAQQAGLRDHDVILAVDEARIRSRSDLMREIGRRAPGTTVKLEIRRGNQRMRYNNVVLGKWPAKNEDEIIAPLRRMERTWRGLVVDFSTARHKYLPARLSQNPLPGAVLVTEVLSNSPASDAEIKPGDYIARVHDSDVLTPQDFQRTVDRLNGPVRLRRVRDGEVREIVVEPD